MRGRVRRGRRRTVARAGPAAGPGRAGRARPSRRVRRGRRVERRCRGRVAAGPVSARAPGRRPRDRAPRCRPALPPTRPARGAPRPYPGRDDLRRGGAGDRRLAAGALRRDRAGGRSSGIAPVVPAGDRRPADPCLRRPATHHRRGVRATAGRRPATARDGRAVRGRDARRAVRPVRLGADHRLQGSRHRRAVCRTSTRTCGRRCPSTTPSSTSGTRRTPIRSGAWPSRSARSPTTARSTPSAATASRSAAGPPTAAAPRWRASSWPPASCSSADGSDSLSLDEALELLTTTGWELTPALLTAIPEALALRRAPHPHVATLRRRTAGFLAPWDGPAAIVFADGRHVGRPGRPQRAAAGGLRRDPRPAGRRRLRDRRRPVHRRRDGPARAARPGRAAAGRAAPAGDPRGRRGEGPCPARVPDPRPAAAGVRGPLAGSAARAPRPTAATPTTDRHALPRRSRRRARPARHQDDGARGPRAALEHGRRHADARSRPARPAGRRPPAPGVRPGHEPGRSTPSASGS